MTQTELPDGVDAETAERAMRRILQAEKEKLYMDLPRGINDDIQAVIEDEVK
jgi:hypothetical protein